MPARLKNKKQQQKCSQNWACIWEKSTLHLNSDVKRYDMNYNQMKEI